eukprot:97848-Alexandrium_andersonii.AAC.1
MSASLVGSEMCIRDRVGCLAGCHPRTAALACRAGASFSLPAGPLALPALCLLYTSDAADDM